MKDINNICSAVIRRLRTDRGLSQKELAEKCGLSQQAINRIEHGERNIEFELLLKFAKILNFDILDLVQIAETLESDELALLDMQLEPEKWGLNNTQTNIVAHFDEDGFTEDELDEIRQFAEFIKSRRNDK